MGRSSKFSPGAPHRGGNTMNSFTMRLRTKFVLCVAAACGLLGYVAMVVSPPIPQAAAQIIANIRTSLAGGEYLCDQRNTVSSCFSTATLSGYTRSTQLLYATVTTVSDAATTAMQTLGSFSLPANTLNTGTVIRIMASWHAASDGNTKSVACNFGSESILSGTLTTNNKNGSCEMIVTNIGTILSPQQIAYANMLVDTTNITGYVSTTAAEITTNPILISFTATNATASAGDIILNELIVERLGN